MDVTDAVVGALFVIFLVVAAGAGYLYLNQPAEPPEFEQTGELRFEAVGDWEDPGPSDRFDRRELEENVLEYTNEMRRSEGLTPLDDNNVMVEAARSHSRDMAAHGYVGHTNSEGETEEDRLAQFEGDTCPDEVGENAAVAYYGVREHDPWQNETVVNRDESDIARSLVHSWMASPPHRENLLSSSYSSVSVGVYVSAGSAVFGTQMFCG